MFRVSPLALFLTITVVPVLSFSQPQKAKSARRRRRHPLHRVITLLENQKLQKSIRLSNAQKEALKALKNKFEKETKNTYAALEKVHPAIRAEMDKEKPDKTKVLTLIGQRSTLRNFLTEKIIMTMIDVKGILTTAQQKTLKHAHRRRGQRRVKSLSDKNQKPGH